MRLRSSALLSALLVTRYPTALNLSSLKMWLALFSVTWISVGCLRTSDDLEIQDRTEIYVVIDDEFPEESGMAENEPAPPEAPIEYTEWCNSLECGDLSWKQIRSGEFVMGVKEPDFNMINARSLLVAAFEISTSEVTVGQFRRCVEAGACEAPDFCERGEPTWTDMPRGNEALPVNCVHLDDARDFAAWSGHSLPSEGQWEYAARSEGLDVDYSWGSNSISCELATFNYCWYAPTPMCTRTVNTAQGLCDMSGNLYEWVEREAFDEESLINGLIKGGAWNQDSSALNVRARANIYYLTRVDYIGFRVVRGR